MSPKIYRLGALVAAFLLTSSAALADWVMNSPIDGNTYTSPSGFAQSSGTGPVSTGFTYKVTNKDGTVAGHVDGTTNDIGGGYNVSITDGTWTRGDGIKCQIIVSGSVQVTHTITYQ